MNITLPTELERRVRQKLERGDYDTADALVEEAVYRQIEEGEWTWKACENDFSGRTPRLSADMDWSLTSIRRTTSQGISTNEASRDWLSYGIPARVDESRYVAAVLHYDRPRW